MVSQWNQDNPNVLTLLSSLEMEDPVVRGKVTKRSRNVSYHKENRSSINLEAQMGYSEFSRVSVEAGQRRISVLYPKSFPRGC